MPLDQTKGNWICITNSTCTSRFMQPRHVGTETPRKIIVWTGQKAKNWGRATEDRGPKDLASGVCRWACSQPQLFVCSPGVGPKLLGQRDKFENQTVGNVWFRSWDYTGVVHHVSRSPPPKKNKDGDAGLVTDHDGGVVWYTSRVNSALFSVFRKTSAGGPMGKIRPSLCLFPVADNPGYRGPRVRCEKLDALGVSQTTLGADT